MLNFWIEHTPCISGSSTSASLDNRGCYLLKGMACFIFLSCLFCWIIIAFVAFRFGRSELFWELKSAMHFKPWMRISWMYSKILGELSFHSNLLFFSEKLLLLSVSDHFGLFVVKNLLSVRNLARHTRSTVSCVSVSDFVKSEHWSMRFDFRVPIFPNFLYSMVNY